MSSRMLSGIALGVTLALGTGLVTRTVTAAPAAEKVAPSVHEGTFVSANGHEFKMKGADGKEHMHMLGPDAKITDHAGKVIKLTDIKAGTKIRVTTKEGELKTALKVECLS